MKSEMEMVSFLILLERGAHSSRKMEATHMDMVDTIVYTLHCIWPESAVFLVFIMI